MDPYREQFFDEEETFRVTLPSLARCVGPSSVESTGFSRPSPSPSLGSEGAVRGLTGGSREAGGDPEGALTHHGTTLKTRREEAPQVRPYTSSGALWDRAGRRVVCVRDVVDTQRRAALARAAVQDAITQHDSREVACAEHQSTAAFQDPYHPQIRRLLECGEAKQARPRSASPVSAASATPAASLLRHTTSLLRQQVMSIVSKDPSGKVEVLKRGCSPVGPRQPTLYFTAVPARFI